MSNQLRMILLIRSSNKAPTLIKNENSALLIYLGAVRNADT